MQKTIDLHEFKTTNAALDRFAKGYGPWPASLEVTQPGTWNGLKGPDAFQGNNVAVCRVTGREFLYDLEGTDVCDVRETKV